ncbi:ABC transporter ATP-binding protein [Polymorphobacter multimanifer]|uniref:Putative ABC transport system ATP-binding protein n=1 Tax=Polymorphobacter multimanifer TaxID=1070431 RepID=A0A841LJA4_9SPHN|nr:ABC transporter ATP-binding protein [Polymorphobacter multimanifer]MBB6229038.1 putative ABC transport system ATP-binding protein [Polymorphobacter multimanifer]GGI77139.1 ABC transporter ATP-binding protein [Polymorphobacter multimanifer]
MNACLPIAVPTSPLVTLNGVHKSHGRGEGSVPIFRGLDLEFARGEFVAIMGPSGSGKTTLLNLVGGIDHVDGGSILFDGRPMSGMGDGWLARWRADNVGFVFQFYNLMPYLTAAQNVELPLLLTRLDRRQRRERVALVLDLVGLSDRARHRPAQLSGGQQQRVAIARALVADPQLLLADEPTGDLDRATAEDVLTMLALVSGELGKTVIMVTHDPLAAARADRTLVLDKGMMVFAPAGAAA